MPVRKYVSLILVLMFAFTLVAYPVQAASSEGLNVPIIVSEALTRDSDYFIQTGKRQNMPGMNRVNEPLTVGIPLAEDPGITNISQLGLNGVSLQQFRPLDYWPNGNIKWVLVDTQANVLANNQTNIFLVSGTGNSGGSNLAVDNGSYLSVDTGTAQFTIKKSNFNMIDKAVVNGKELVLQNNSGGLSMVGYQDATYTMNGKTHTLVKDRVYDSKNDPDSTAVVEENGPVRTVIKATGSFKDISGNRLMDYTVRLHFYKGKSYVKSQVIMRNGAREDDKPIKKTFSSMQVSLPLNLGAGKSFEFSTNKGLFSGDITSNAYIYQAFSLSHRNAGTELEVYDGSLEWYNPPMNRLTTARDANFEQKGLEIKNGQTVLRSLGDQNDWTNNVAEIKDQNNNGLTVAMQYMSSYWPTSIEFGTDGSAEIGVFSKFNSKKDITMGWATHETREIILDFHTTPIDNNAILYRLEQPVVGRAPIQHYQDTKALFGENGIATAEEFEQFFITNYGKLDYTHPKQSWAQSNTGLVVWRTYWYSGHVSEDYPLEYQLTFLKNGAGGKYMAGLQKTMFNYDSAVYRTDGFDYSMSPMKTGSDYPVDETNSYNTGGGKNRFDSAHNSWRAMPIFYYMTGDEEIKDAINDYLEQYIKSKDKKIYEGMDLRSYSRDLTTLASGYEFNQDDRLRTKLEITISDLLDSRDNPPNLNPYGRNLDRGYIWLDLGGYGSFKEPVIHSFFLYTLHIEDVWQALRVLKKYDKSYPRAEELEDYLLGAAQFAYNEAILIKPDGTDFGYRYNHFLHNVNEWDYYGRGTGEDELIWNYMRKDDTSRGMLIAYSNTGDPKYLEMGKKLFAFGAGLSEPYQAHNLIYTSLHGLSGFWSYVNNISAVNNGNSKYTLTWIVPQGATAYKIKFSDKPIVDWLGFDQTTRVYQYDPASYIAFFAATNVDDEPAPLQSGSVQSYTIDIAQAINSYNAARNLSPGNPSYVTYDPSKAYYFAIKYYQEDALPSPSPLAITTSFLPDGIKGQGYNIGLQIVNGTSPFQWQILSGSLPEGLTLGNDGKISGTPSRVGTYNFTVKVTDSSMPAQAATKEFSLRVEAMAIPPTAQANGPYEGQVGTPLTLNAGGSYDTDGTIVSYEWDVNDDGIWVSADSGVATHTWSFPYGGNISLRVTDNDGLTATDTTSVIVMAPPLKGDLDGDGDVDRDDLNILLSYRNKPASACPACDLDGDGMITVLDARKLVLLCTRPSCACK